uniref:Uncharacterized protein n=1 Tax=Rhizophora mucronata TaxID=61149 RepID=A0A2P2IJJ8_RHIMU
MHTGYLNKLLDFDPIVYLLTLSYNIVSFCLIFAGMF